MCFDENKKLKIISDKLSGKTAIITGCSNINGLGFKISKILYKHGANIVVTNFNNINLLSIYNELVDDNKFLHLRVDIQSRDSIKRLINKTIEKFGKINILVNNAGIHQKKPFLEITTEDWDTVLNTNLRGSFIMAQECIPHMSINSKIINISSIAGRIGGIESAHYAISKGGVINLTKTLSRCFPNIQSNCVAPSLIKTDMANGLNPTTKIGQPIDIANTVLFLASQESNFITGQTIDVNGGLYCG